MMRLRQAKRKGPGDRDRILGSMVRSFLPGLLTGYFKTDRRGRRNDACVSVDDDDVSR